MGVLDKLKDRLKSEPSAQSSTPAQGVSPSAKLSPLDSTSIHRYRKQRGVNLGSWFVLERWITESPFRNAAAPGKSDYDVAKGANAKQVLESHWDSWIREDDWRWIKEHGYNSVRIPIGYYHLCAAIPEVLKGTDFEPFHNVFAGAWPRIQRAIEAARSNGLGVLIDLHAAAGAQNGDAHSGVSSGKAKLFSSKANLQSTSSALKFMASHLSDLPHVVGLELLNEPQNNDKLQGWYESTLREVRQVAAPEFPIYIGDAWNTQHYAQWTGKREDFVVLDHHLYRCFTDQDKQDNGDAHAARLRSGRDGTAFGASSAAARGSFVVGEWSAALNPRSVGQVPDGEKDRQRREFVRAQLQLFEQKAAGWWYWTYKREKGWDAGWSARDATTAEILPGRVDRQVKGKPAEGQKDESLRKAHGMFSHKSHRSYWASHGGSPDPEVFAPGFSQGWDDAMLFLFADDGPHELGFITHWARRRKTEYEAGNQKLGKAAWEWEHGFEQGVKACNAACIAQAD